ncbi:hypothetical protein V8B55DRAFT_1531510 [Mucor lusitanicus]|uniref:MARVEL domain-containing protein n=2 Tax=Mucor circinelloides f. lusitanicus TaxID=29924 RepID=A0A168ING2_MUCCL|nr:hypothetical protein FB192DRAFT_1328449 [Mucor lusitanicus]OAD00152.1 hypothetical protein MUCCIDRAFT_156980 [Mucor lusitanicus CBS 277.49]
MAGYKLDVPVDLSEQTTDKLELAKKIIHLVTGACGILTIAVVAPLIATEARYLGAGVAGPNYTLFVALVSLPVPFLLVYFPWMYEKYNKFKRLGKFCLKNRTNLIFCGFNTFLWATAGIAITVHSNNASNCALNPDLTETYGDDYTSAWSTQCNLAKVTAGFAWITCILWLVTLAITGVSFWKEKSLIQQRLNEHRLNKQSKLEEQRQQDEEYGHGGTPMGGYAAASGRVYDEDEEDPFSDSHRHQQHQQQHQSPFVDPMSEHYDAYNHNRTSYTPGFDQPVGQYAADPHQHQTFSPMPTPQHMPHPEPSYNQNHF